MATPAILLTKPAASATTTAAATTNTVAVLARSFRRDDAAEAVRWAASPPALPGDTAAAGESCAASM